MGRFIVDVPRPIYVDTPEQVESAVARCADSTRLGVDTETLRMLSKEEYTNMTDQALYMGLCPDPDVRFLVPAKHIPKFRDILANPTTEKNLSYYAFDAHRLANAGLDLNGPIFDTVMGDFLCDEDTRENRHGLKECSWDYFGLPMGEYKELFGKYDPRSIVPGHEVWDRFLDYSSLDAWATRRLAEFLKDRLSSILVWPNEKDDEKTYLDHYWQYEEPQLRTLFNMERRGIKVDKKALERIRTSLEQEMFEIAEELCITMKRPFSPGSGKQIGQYFFEEKGLTHRGLTPKGAYVTDEEVLSSLAGDGYVEAQMILDYKAAQKLKGTYAEGLSKWVQADGKIHTSYSATKVTGRLGSSDPNLQNVPRPDNDPHGIRTAFIPDDEDDVLIVADYAQLEMRILAEISGDFCMIDAINNGLDMHSFTAAMMMGITYEEFIARKKAKDPLALLMRQAAKAVGFGIVYGTTEFGLARTLTLKFAEMGVDRLVTPEEAKDYIDKYLRTYPGVDRYMAEYKAMARSRGYVQTVVGRFRRLSKARSRNFRERHHAENQAINSPIQGSAADIVKISMIRTDRHPRLRELGCTLRLQVHDELVFNCRGGRSDPARALECVKIIQGEMENPFPTKPFSVALPTDPVIVTNYGAAKAA